MLPLKCATAQYHQIICAMKSHTARTCNIPKHWKNNKTRDVVSNKYVFYSYFDKILYLFQFFFKENEVPGMDL